MHNFILLKLKPKHLFQCFIDCNILYQRNATKYITQEDSFGKCDILIRAKVLKKDHTKRTSKNSIKLIKANPLLFQNNYTIESRFALLQIRGDLQKRGASDTKRWAFMGQLLGCDQQGDRKQSNIR